MCLPVRAIRFHHAFRCRCPSSTIPGREKRADALTERGGCDRACGKFTPNSLGVGSILAMMVTLDTIGICLRTTIDGPLNQRPTEKFMHREIQLVSFRATWARMTVTRPPHR